MTKHIKTIIQTLLFTAIGVGLVWYRYNDLSVEDKQAMFAAFSEITWWYLLPLFIIAFFSHYFRAVRWKQLMDPIGIKVSMFNAVGAVLVGYLANVFVPRMGEVAKCTYLARYEKADVDKLIGTVIIERLIDMICFLILIVLTIVFQFSYIQPYALKMLDYFIGKLYNEAGQLNVTLVLLAILACLGLIGIGYFIYKKVMQTKLRKFILGLKDGITSIRKVKSVPKFVFNSFMIWGLYTLSAILVFKAMPSISDLPLLAGLSIMTFGSMAMIVPAPGAIAYPIIVAPVLILYGVSEGLGQAYGWVNWALQNVTVITFGMIALLILPIVNKYKNEKTSISRK